MANAAVHNSFVYLNVEMSLTVEVVQLLQMLSKGYACIAVLDIISIAVIEQNAKLP